MIQGEVPTIILTHPEYPFGTAYQTVPDNDEDIMCFEYSGWGHYSRQCRTGPRCHSCAGINNSRQCSDKNLRKVKTSLESVLTVRVTTTHFQ